MNAPAATNPAIKPPPGSSWQPFLTAQWWTIPVIDFKASTPLIFDIGVYLAVLGSVLGMFMALMEVDKDEP